MTDETQDPMDPRPDSDDLSASAPSPSEPMASAGASDPNPGANPNLGGTPGPTPSSPPYTPPTAPGSFSAPSGPPLDPIVPMSSMVTSEEKTHSLIAWILSLVGVAVIGPLIFFIIDKDKPFAYRHAAMALGLGIFSFICSMVGSIIPIIGWCVLLPAALIFHIYVCIMGAIAANNGREYDVPLIGKTIANMFKV